MADLVRAKIGQSTKVFAKTINDNFSELETRKVDHDGTKVLSDNNYSTTEKTKLSGIEENSEVNIIEVVKVNGTAQSISNKGVDITVPTKTSDITNDGNGTSDFATESYVNTNGGKIDNISIDGVNQTITNKVATLDLSNYANKNEDNTFTNNTKFGGSNSVWIHPNPYISSEIMITVSGSDCYTGISSYNITTDSITLGGSDLSTALNGKANTTDIPDVIDNLSSTSTEDALSANQGKNLKALIDSQEFAKSFADISAMITNLNSANNSAYKVAFELLITDLEVPDFWITEVMGSSVTYTYTTDQALITAVQTAPVQIGYYKISLSETAKVDLTDYVQNTRTIAGVDLQDDITTSELKTALSISNIDNTSDANKPVSTATQTALNDKVDKVTGKGLSTNDFTDTLETKLNGIDDGAEVNVLETIQVGGTDVTANSKKINFVAGLNVSLSASENAITINATTQGSSIYELNFTNADAGWSAIDADGYYTLTIVSTRTPIMAYTVSGTTKTAIMATVSSDGTNIYITTDEKFTGMVSCY